MAPQDHDKLETPELTVPVPPSAPEPEPPPEQTKQTKQTQQPQHPARRTRLSGLWVAIGCFAVIVVFLLVFILQNDQRVNISYLGLHARMQLGVALLFAAIGGVLLTGLAGTARILQLRAAARRRAHAEKTDPIRRTASRS
jgi:lipopolysaccharide assembly protein A